MRSVVLVHGQVPLLQHVDVLRLLLQLRLDDVVLVLQTSGLLIVSYV